MAVQHSVLLQIQCVFALMHCIAQGKCRHGPGVCKAQTQSGSNYETTTTQTKLDYRKTAERQFFRTQVGTRHEGEQKCEAPHTRTSLSCCTCCISWACCACSCARYHCWSRHLWKKVGGRTYAFARRTWRR